MTKTTIHTNCEISTSDGGMTVRAITVLTSEGFPVCIVRTRYSARTGFAVTVIEPQDGGSLDQTITCAFPTSQDAINYHDAVAATELDIR